MISRCGPCNCRAYDSSILRCLRGQLRASARCVPVSATDAVEHESFAPVSGRSRSYPEIEFDVFPCVAPLRLQPKRGGRLIAAMHHAVFATVVASDAVDDTIFVPLRFLQQFRVARVMTVGH